MNLSPAIRSCCEKTWAHITVNCQLGTKKSDEMLTEAKSKPYDIIVHTDGSVTRD